MTLLSEDADGYDTTFVSKIAAALRHVANTTTDAAAVAAPTTPEGKRALVLAIAVHKDNNREIATWLAKSMVAGGLTLAANDTAIQNAVTGAFPKIAFVFDPPALGS